jgi:hypothetical protein
VMSTRYAGMLLSGSHALPASEPATLSSVDRNQAELTSGRWNSRGTFSKVAWVLAKQPCIIQDGTGYPPFSVA